MSAPPRYAIDEDGRLLRGFYRGFHPFDAKRRFLAVFHVYGDLSGTVRRKVLTAACYFGNEAQWAQLDRLWAKALAFAKVPYFHATDFFACKGEFSRMVSGSLRHRQVEKLFTEAALEAGLIGRCYSLDNRVFPVIQKELLKVRAKQRIATPRLMVVQGCLEWVARYWDECRIGPHHRVAAWFEAERGMGEVPTFFTFAKARQARWTEPFIGVALVDKKKLRVVQAADLLAHAAWRELEYGAVKLPPSLARILNSGKVDSTWMSEADAEKSAKGLAAMIDYFPDGLVRPRQRKVR